MFGRNEEISSFYNFYDFAKFANKYFELSDLSNEQGKANRSKNNTKDLILIFKKIGRQRYSFD